MRIFFAVICIIFFSQLFCEETKNIVSCHPYYCPSYKKDDNKGKLIQSMQIMPGYNAPARYDFLFFVSGGYLLFQPIEKGSIFAYSVNNINLEKTKIFDVNAKFKSGFEITVGCSTQFDDWSFFLNYMRFHMSKSTNVHQNAICTWSSRPDSTPVTMSHVKANWKLYMDLFDLFISRPFYSGTHVIIFPSFGLKGGMIEQKFDTNSIRLSNLSDIFSTGRSRSWLFGLCAGLKLKYILDFGLSFFTQGSVSLFYQDYKVRNMKNQYDDPSLLEDNSFNSLSNINPNLNLAAGIEWGDYFFDRNSHISLLFGYEGQVYWNQNFINELKEYRRNRCLQEAGSLFLHGIIAKLRIDF